MATRGIIGRLVSEGNVEHPRFEGRYHHWDSYPSGLGATLYQAYHKYFHQKVTAMMQFFIEEHRGWSNLVGTDLHNTPGFIGDPSDPRRETHPQCYCHGARREQGYLYTTFAEAIRVGCEYAYIVDERNATLSIYHEAGSSWLFIGTIDLQGIEPRWEYLDVL